MGLFGFKKKELSFEEKMQKAIDDAYKYMNNSKWNEAIDLLTEPAKAGFGEAIYYLALAKAEIGEYENALEMANSLLDVIDDEEFKQELEELIQKIKYSLKNKQAKIDEQKKAIRQELFNKGLNAFNEKNSVDAYNFWKEAAELGELRALFCLAKLQARRGQSEDALSYLAQILEYNLTEKGVNDAQKLKNYILHNVESFEKGIKLFDQGNYIEAIECFVKSADNNFIPSIMILGQMASEGLVGDESRATHWFSKAAELGECDAQLALASRYLEGIGVDVNIEEAFKWFTIAAKQGEPDAQYNLYALYKNNLVSEINGEQAFDWLVKSANQGCDYAQLELAYEYSNGELCEKNLEESFKWCKKAAEQGDLEAQYELYKKYNLGDGCEVDKEKASEWLVRSATEGFAESQYKLGFRYHFGINVEVDKKKAFEWYKKAAENGHCTSMGSIADMYKEGEGCEKNLEESFKWCKKAAENGHVYEMLELSDKYEKGIGCKKNIEEAKKWKRKYDELKDE